MLDTQPWQERAQEADVAPSAPWWRAWASPVAQGTAQGLMVARGDLLLSSCPHRPLCCRARSKLPPNKGWKAFSCGIALSWVFGFSPMGRECCLVKCGGQSSDGVSEGVTVFRWNQEEAGSDCAWQGFCCNVGATMKHSRMSGDVSPETKATESQS